MPRYPFGVEFQREVLHCMLNGGFLDRTRGMLDSELFSDPVHRVVAEEVLKFFDGTGAPPSGGALETQLRKAVSKNRHVKITHCKMELAKVRTLKGVDPGYTARQIREFAADTRARRVIEEYETYRDQGRYDAFTRELEEALSVVRPSPQLTPYSEGIKDRFSSYKGGYKKVNPVPTGVPTLDFLLSGGPGAGEVGIVLGITGSGKSHLCVHLGAVAAEAGARVQHYTLELTRSQLLARYDRRFTGMSNEEIYKKRSKLAREHDRDNLLVAHYPKYSLTPGMLRSAIKKGGKPDLVIVDYPYLMYSGKNDFAETNRFEVERNYAEIENIALEFGCPVWAPFQSNRAAHNLSVSEGNHITKEYSGDAYAVSRNVPIVLSWNQTAEEFMVKRGRLWLDKNRDGLDQKSIPVHQDWGVSKIKEVVE